MKKVLVVTYWLIPIFYFSLLINTVFLARESLRSVNSIPFHTILAQTANGGISLNVWRNVLMFIPLGIYICLHSKARSTWKAVVWIVGTSVFIEVVQFVFAIGATDIDDVILNTVGGAIGIGIYKIFAGIFKTEEKIKMAIATLSFIIGAPVLILVMILFIANR